MWHVSLRPEVVMVLWLPPGLWMTTCPATRTFQALGGVVQREPTVAVPDFGLSHGVRLSIGTSPIGRLELHSGRRH